MRTWCVQLLGIMALLAAGVFGAGPARAESIQPHPSTATATAAPTPAPAVVIALQGVIDDYSRDALFKRFDEARRTGAKVIILRLNTPGGLVTAGLDISRFLKQQ